MAVISSKNPSGLKLKYYCGKNDEGNAITKSKTYSNLKPNADEEDVYEVGVKIASLSEYTLSDLMKIDTTVISR
jgi:hypothetical protein